jgi:WD40 repeat protein
MPVELVGALVGWMFSLVDDAGIQLVHRLQDKRAFIKAVRIAIDEVVDRVDSSSQQALRLGLRECFSAPPQLELDLSTSVSEGLRAAIGAQVAQLDQMVHSDTGQPFYQAISVDRIWLNNEVAEAILTALRHVEAKGSLVELVRAVDAADVSARLNTIEKQGRQLLYQALVKPGHGGTSDPAGWRGPQLPVPRLRGDEVARPDLMRDLVGVVVRAGANVVGMTTALWGAGGFGKTTMARLLVHRDEVREEFPDGVVWVTIGADAVGSQLADKVADAVYVLSGVRPGLTDPLLAGVELGRVLSDRRVLLVVDDVWTEAQVEPFLVGGSATVRLFTTRVRGVLPSSAELVRVDEMNRSEATELLTAGVGEVPSGVVEGLLAVTGRWPVLLSLVNGAVRDDLNAGCRVDESMREILRELGRTGPTALDVADPDVRHKAVARTIDVSLVRLTVEERARYLELAVFGLDVAIPGQVLGRYWQAACGWSEFQTRRYCQRLAELALVSDYRRDPEQVVLHDVIGAYLRERTKHRRGELHRALVDAHRSLVPSEGQINAWWQLSAEQTYLWAWLPTHLRGAGLDQELQACLNHPRWLVGKLEHGGPAKLEGDLALSDDPLSRKLRTSVRQNGHVLGPLRPPGSLAATLASRLPDDGPTRAIAEQVLGALTMPHLRPITTLPDLPHPALSRVLPDDTQGVVTLVVAPDGSWLASAGHGRKVRIWDPATGLLRHTLIGHTGAVWKLVVAPDGSWLASAGHGRKVRIWDPATGLLRHTLTGDSVAVGMLVVAPDGSWLASAGYDGEVRIWDPTTGLLRHTLIGHTAEVVVGVSVVAPDGSCLASAGYDGEVRIWDPVTGRLCHTLTGHPTGVQALVVAPDGSWLASADAGGDVRIWDLATGTARQVLPGHTREIAALVVAPDGSWLASAGADGKVRIWDPVTGLLRHTLTGHSSGVLALAVAPDGSWLAWASGLDGDVRICDPVSGEVCHNLTGHFYGVMTLAVAPDGSWLASAGDDGEVRIWDPATGGWGDFIGSGVRALVAAPDGSWLAAADGRYVQIWDPATATPGHTLKCDTDRVRALVVAPDGSWLASASESTTEGESASGSATGGEVELRIWDPVTGIARHLLTGHTGTVRALAVAPDGSWLASAGDNGELRIWDPITGTAPHLLTGHTLEVTALAVALDGSWLASAGDDGELRIWDPTTGAPVTSLRVAGRLYHLVLASKTIAAGGDGDLYFLTFCPGAHSN